MHKTTLFVILAATLSGCAGADDSAEKALLGADGQEFAEQGILHVMTYADYGAPLDGARISMIGTIFGAKTNADGSAEFLNVPAGEYTLRAEMDKFFPVERKVTVAPGGMTHEEVVLLRIDQSPDARTHQHNYWRGASEVLLADAMMAATPRHHTDIMAWYPFMDGYNSVLNGLHRMNNNQTGEDPDYLFRIPVQEETPDGERRALIYPGAERVEIMVEWGGALTSVEKMGIAYIPPGNAADEWIILDRKESGGVWDIPVAPGQADAGHQTFSFWNFFLYSGNEFMDEPAGGHPVQYSLDAPFHVTVRVFKGELYEEAPHRDFWQGEREKHILIESVQDIDPAAVRDWRVPESGHVFLRDGEMVYPGTKRMSVQYTYVHGDMNDNDGELLGFMSQPQTLTFRMADQNPWETPVGLYRQFLAIPCEDAPSWGTCLRYEIDMEAMWADAYYQDTTLWTFLTNAEGYEEERRYTPGGGKLTMELDITLMGPES